MATFLDPHSKADLLSTASLEDIKDCIKMTMEGGTDEQSTGTGSEIGGEAGMNEETREDIAPTNDEDIDMEDCFTELMSKATKNAKVVVTKEIIEEEIDLYIRQPLIQKKSSPVEWWNKVKFMFPNISELVPLYLSAPSSSVYSERLFSESGNISDNKRKNLLPENLELLTFLYHNLPLINYHY
ncbi:zinc finger BED domain-containing protein 4-like [Belonocnema kinseyi]|uniref:zinc finger BED domain-containing protein 4-like n=1 Tax=Belonocnema kinseyi TaxID=2817044 RepID=UPI00143CF45D|nr:zinc finger BED domain-containing protein 4-like [Belonocnema kinseyi]